ncbi:Lrp/AsnC family transcriptional regulator [Pseudovibrio sp. Tun.PSC04-5.I4]|uniref:Lrp/AsnC family transcriptional regulator n=1 Tax=Pseudovibrio sp. Tun.PSC04-5.I4 TaxID=1798213 RepID=UPI0008921118|nr:Lrp/AsnC family transcriptional regulator [Pseudovibrio sp. Tun.PSC04-5.I4]SDR24426.1 DNA-binding transcriptional regulator, Lrp family [Pseudovibrio sp. Tun.PSC04-5.I4]
MNLDRTDYEILEILQDNALCPNKQIATEVNLSPSACHERVKRLKDNGVLTSSHAVINPKSFGIGAEAMFFIQLDKHEELLVEEFIEEVIALPEVKSVALISGAYDIIAHLRVRDINHLKSLAFDNFTKRAYITKIESSIVYEFKESRVQKPL